MNVIQIVRDHWVHILVPMGFVLGCYLDRRNDEKLTAFRNKSLLFKRLVWVLFKSNISQLLEVVLILYMPKRNKRGNSLPPEDLDLSDIILYSCIKLYGYTWNVNKSSVYEQSITDL